MATIFRIHYQTHFGDFISIRGSHNGLSWEQGVEAKWTSEEGEDIWTLSLPFRKRENKQEGGEKEFIHFKPLINDEVWAKGVDYVASPGGVIDIYPFFFATQGTIFKTTFKSSILKNERKLAIYLPPSYHENSSKYYPLMFFQDGHNLFDTVDSYCGETWELSETLDHLTVNGNIKEYIIVGIYPNNRNWEYLPTECDGEGGGAELYLDSLTQELKPFITQNLRVNSRKTHENIEKFGKFENFSCAIAGSSYGGNIALYAWTTRPHEFDLCGSFSPALKYDNRIIPEIVKRNLTKRHVDDKLYMDCGTIKDQQSAVVEMADYFMREERLNKEQFKFVIGEGHEHTERHWAIRTPFALSYLFSDPLRMDMFVSDKSDNESEYYQTSRSS